ncbi:MAG: hypothetical protein IIV43_05470, partial [Oscillospiraceae bacterium]|nr:hypothetical protein [Oscillospiraceae bacterium]
MTATRAGREVYCVITDAHGNSVTTNTVKLVCLPSKIWEQWTQPVVMAAGTYPTYGGSTTGYYEKGQKFGGILYSSTYRDGTDVLWQLNHSTYYSAVANPASLLYTEDYRGRVFNEAAWAGSVCSTTALRACGYSYPYTTAEIAASSEFTEKTDHRVDSIEFGDLLWVKGHTAGVIGVNKGDDGRVSSVKIIEQASYVKVFEVTAANWDSYFADHWTTIYRGSYDERLTEPVDYPENLSIIFERGNNTYVTDYAKMLFYIPTASTVYLTKNGTTTQYAKSGFPTQVVNGTTVYDLASLFTGVGDYYFHTDENATDICIKVIDKGNIAISGTTATLSGYRNCRPLGYRIIKILDQKKSSAYNFYEAPEGYTSEAAALTFKWLNTDAFTVENVPDNTAGWKLEVIYDTSYGWARDLSDNYLHSNGMSLSLCYDDRYDVSGKTVEIVNGDAVTLKGDTLVATGIGTATVKIDGVLHEITVEKAKINLVMIMGQSNAGNHFANATSAVTCPPGTAYWWKDGATAPVDYTEPSKGFHTPLLAELYAQSAAAGDPVKNVMLWTEGATSKNGQSIVKWAVESGSGISTAGTDKAAAMMKNCLSYYQQHSDTYEIVGKGVYWLQGESDYNMDPQRYIRLFTTMWERLESEGMEYLAFLRVRGPTFNNTNQNMDTVYNAASAAQFEMVRNRDDMFMATTLTEAWTGTVNTSHSVDVSSYITVKETYGKSPTYSDSYGNKATYADGVLTTTMKELYGSNNKVHYGIFGYGLIGADAAYNMHRALNGGTVTFVQTDSSGRKAAEHIAAAGSVQMVDIEDMAYDLSFYPGCGS